MANRKERRAANSANPPSGPQAQMSLDEAKKEIEAVIKRHNDELRGMVQRLQERGISSPVTLAIAQEIQQHVQREAIQAAQGAQAVKQV